MGCNTDGADRIWHGVLDRRSNRPLRQLLALCGDAFEDSLLLEEEGFRLRPWPSRPPVFLGRTYHGEVRDGPICRDRVNMLFNTGIQVSTKLLVGVGEGDILELK